MASYLTGDSFNIERFIRSGQGTRPNYKHIERMYTDAIVEAGKTLNNMPGYFKKGSLALVATKLLSDLSGFDADIFDDSVNSDAKIHEAYNDIFAQAFPDLVDNYDITTMLTPAQENELGMVMMTAGTLYANTVASAGPKEILAYMMVAGAIVYAEIMTSGCVEEAEGIISVDMDGINSKMTKEISDGEFDDPDGGLTKLGEFVDDNYHGDGGDSENEASPLMVDGIPYSTDPKYFVTPEGDCSMLKKSTEYWGWGYMEGGTDDHFLDKNKPDICSGIVSDGDTLHHVVVYNKKFLEYSDYKMGIYATGRTENLDDLKVIGIDDIEWKNIWDLEPNEHYDVRTPVHDFFSQTSPMTPREDSGAKGTPDKSFASGVFKLKDKDS